MNSACRKSAIHRRWRTPTARRGRRWPPRSRPMAEPMDLTSHALRAAAERLVQNVAMEVGLRSTPYRPENVLRLLPGHIAVAFLAIRDAATQQERARLRGPIDLVLGEVGVRCSRGLCAVDDAHPCEKHRALRDALAALRGGDT